MSDSSGNPSQLVSEYQDTLLRAIERFFGRQKIPKSIRRAFLDTPRHLFVPRFFSATKRSWITLTENNLRERLAELYADHPVCIYRDELGKSVSTISQPSLVLYMLNLLDLEPGMRVFELGGGSGWNAALMAHIVGPSGQVVSYEIVDELVPVARERLSALGLEQVRFEAGDGSRLSPELPTFDRGVFTASAWDLPSCFYEKIKTGGLLLLVIKALPHFDLLTVARKSDDRAFASELLLTCSFVPVTGSYVHREAIAQPLHAANAPELATELDWKDIKISPTDLKAFLEFVMLVFDCQQTYLVEIHGADVDEEFWGISSEDGLSLVIFNEERIQLYGTDACLVSLRRAAKRWSKAGKPSVEDLKLSLHASGTEPVPTNDQWLVRRGESTLLWGV